MDASRAAACEDPAAVRDVERQLEEKEGIERQGLMLSTLMKLKQICNHPAQFLQDGSPFTPERSHKLERLGQMLEEVMAEGDSVLIFSQFTEVGSQLEALFKRGLGHNTYYLRGGTVTAAVQGNVNHSRGVFQLAGFKVQVGLSIRL